MNVQSLFAEIELYKMEMRIFDFDNPGYLYFLVSNQQIVYIGKTKINPKARIKEHKKTKKFDYYYAFCFPKNRIDEIESKLILQFRPPLNKTYVKKTYTNLTQLQKAKIEKVIAGEL